MGYDYAETVKAVHDRDCVGAQHNVGLGIRRPADLAVGLASGQVLRRPHGPWVDAQRAGEVIVGRDLDRRGEPGGEGFGHDGAVYAGFSEPLSAQFSLQIERGLDYQRQTPAHVASATEALNTSSVLSWVPRLQAGRVPILIAARNGTVGGWGSAATITDDSLSGVRYLGPEGAGQGLFHNPHDRASKWRNQG